MEENKEVKTEETPRAIPAPPAPAAKTEETSGEIKIPLNEKVFDIIYLATALISLSFIVITKIISNFVGYGTIFAGIMAIFIYLISFCGTAFGLAMTAFKKSKPSALLIVNLATLALILMIM